MACNDRQLTDAQREAAFNQQRTGVVRAIRPFIGTPSIENLIDYLNRELIPALRASREKVNDVWKQVVDNAPSANPLAYYFSTTTTNADPTDGRIRLNQATQNTATVIRVSENNARLQTVQPWLDVMSGGPTTPLGTVTLVDAIDPGRFLRFDLNTMTDQGSYWDLGVTLIEASDTNPFVDGEAVTVGFIAGVSAAGSTVPVGSLSPIANDTFLGNVSGGVAAPSAVNLSTLAGAGLAFASHTLDVTGSTSITVTSDQVQRAALTGEVTASANSNATTVTRSTNFQTSPWTADHQFNAEIRLGTTHTESATTGTLNVTLTAGATRLIINSTGDLDLQTITGAAVGRILLVEHIRTSGTGIVTITHATGSNQIATPDENPVYLGQRCTMILCGRGGTPFWDIVAPPSANLWRQTEHATTTGTINNMTRPNGGRYTMLVPSGALTVTGLAAGDSQGELAGIQRQGTTSTCTLTDNDTGSSAANRFATYGNVDLRLGDDELAMFAYIDITSGASNDPRWVCFSHRYPFCNTSANAQGDHIVHTGTDWLLVPAATSTRTTVTNATTTTDFVSLAIPAGTLVGGEVWDVRGAVQYSRGATATASNLTVSFAVSGVGNFSSLTKATQTINGQTGYVLFHCLLQCTATGASGQLTAWTEREDDVTGAVATSRGQSQVTVDTTADVTVIISAAFGTAVNGLSYTTQGGFIHRVR